ncbi:MAG: hypothetical protein WC455_19680 [Dehalococcoidia bacterium]|jgi:hypothetical protein
MSYVIPTSTLSLSEQQRMRAAAAIKGVNTLALAINRDPKTLLERAPYYPIDFVPAATRAGLAGWLSMPLAAVGGTYSLMADNVPAALTPQVPNNAVWVFWGVHILTLNDPVSRLQFFTGSGAIPKQQYDLEVLQDKLEVDGYFTQPMVYMPQDIVTISVIARVATGVGARVVLDAFVIEPEQVTQV